MQQPEHDRTEQATPFRKEESRNRGEVARSGDLNTFVVVGAIVLALMLWGASSWMILERATAHLFALAGTADALAPLRDCGAELLRTVLPFGVFALVIIILGSLLQAGPMFSLVPLEPRFERINPIAGFRRIYGRRLLFELAKNVFKLALLGAVVYFFVRGEWSALLMLGARPAAEQLAVFAREGGALLLRLTAALLVLGLIDWIYTRWQHGRQLMMSRRDVKEEIKRREGDPLVRSRIRELQRENLKQSRSLGKIGDADVLITNPEHVGVALHYRRGRMSAPHIVAKGSGVWLERMKVLARRHAVPIRRYPPLARRLFSEGGLERAIPVETYVEVARVYADLAAERRAATGRYEVSAP